VESNTWPQAPKDAFIVGLKELPEWDMTSPLPHKHIFFGHCYKGQAGWKELLRRFVSGGGTLLDMEFLNDEKGTAIQLHTQSRH
jgi:saccharopine dehydrogenase (NAD+, L-lysine-forming)